MGNVERTGKRISALSTWFRTAGIYCTDLDWIIVNYEKKKIMILEEKCYSNGIKPFQDKLFSLIAMCLKENLHKYKDADGNSFEFVGYYLVQFSNTYHLDGETRINGQLISSEDFEKFVNFELIL